MLNATVDIFSSSSIGFGSDWAVRTHNETFSFSLSRRFSWGQVLSPRVSQLVVQEIFLVLVKNGIYFPTFSFFLLLLYDSASLRPRCVSVFFPEYVTASFSVIFLILLCLLPFIAGVFLQMPFLFLPDTKIVVVRAILSVMINFLRFYFGRCFWVSGVFLSTFVVYFLPSSPINVMGIFGKNPSAFCSKNAVPHE